MLVPHAVCFLVAAWSLTAATIAVAVAPPREAAPTGPLHVYIGTYANADATGIYHLLFDPDKGTLTAAGGVKGVANPSFVAISPSRKNLYAVAEVDQFAGGKGGGVVAFAIDPATGNLTKLNEQPTGGAAPCHVSLDRLGKCVMVANYGGGSFAAYTVNDKGELSPRTAFIQDVAEPGKKRSEGPHGHDIDPSPDNRFAFGVDLGLDKVQIFKLDPDKGTLTPNEPAFAPVAPGAGPRHFAFHPSGKYAYVINERASTVTAFAYDEKQGALKELQTLSTLPVDYKGGNTCAEIAVHPSGKFLYGSNRGHHSIAGFKIDPTTGMLTAAGHQTAGIKEPRNFGLDPSGRFCLVASQGGDNVAVFAIDQTTGALKPTSVKVSIPKPVCVQFVNLGK